MPGPLTEPIDVVEQLFWFCFEAARLELLFPVFSFALWNMAFLKSLIGAGFTKMPFWAPSTFSFTFAIVKADVGGLAPLESYLI